MNEIIDKMSKSIGYVVLNGISIIFASILIHKSLKCIGFCYFNYHKYNKQEGNEKEVLVIKETIKGWVTTIIFHDSSSTREEIKYTIRKIKCNCGKHIIQYKDNNTWIESTNYFDKYYN